jgi:hypothetical protein
MAGRFATDMPRSKARKRRSRERGPASSRAQPAAAKEIPWRLPRVAAAQGACYQPETMRSFAELERLRSACGALPRERGKVALLVVRKGDARHELPQRVEVTRSGGITGDRWSLAPNPNSDKQLTLMMAWAAAAVCDGQPLDRPGDNVLVDLDLAESCVPAGTVLRLGNVRVQVTASPHLGCKKFEARFGQGALAWVNEEANRPLKLRGINCTVLDEGEISLGDAIVVER